MPATTSLRHTVLRALIGSTIFAWPARGLAAVHVAQTLDTIVVANARPLHASEGRLQLEASFGRRGSAAPEYAISTVRDIAVAGNGTVYILDYLAGPLTVRQFDPTGRFIRAIGRPGDGPGEFRNPRSIWVDRAGILYVYSSGNIARFDSSGKPLGDVPVRVGSPTATAETIMVDTAGVIWIRMNVLPPGIAPGPASIDALLQAYQRIRSNGEVIDTVFRPGPRWRARPVARRCACAIRVTIPLRVESARIFCRGTQRELVLRDSGISCHFGAAGSYGCPRSTG